MRRELLGLSTGALRPNRHSSLAILLVMAAFVLPALKPGPDADVFWHLRAGDDLLSGSPGAFRESWSYTAADRAWINHEWLAEWFFALARRIGGEAGLVLFTGLIAGLTAILLWRALSFPDRPAWLFALLLVVGAAAAGDRFVPRPQIFTYLCLAILFERLAAVRHGASPWFLIPLQIFWTNVHGPLWGLFFGSLLILGGGAPALSMRRRLILGFALLGASIVHPQGFHVLTDNIAAVSAGGLYRRTIREWLPLASPLHADLPQIGATWFLIVAAGLALLAGLFSPGRLIRRWGVILCLAAITAAPLAAVRNRDLLAIGLGPLVALLWPDFPERIRKPRRIASVLCGVAAIWAFTIPAFGFAFPGPGYRKGTNRYDATFPPRLSLSTEGFPVAAVYFLRDHPVGSRIFNAYDYSGFLIDRLRDRRIFMDGRYFIYGEDLYRTYLETRDGGPEALDTLDRTQTDLLLIRYPQPDGYQGLADLILVRPEWALVFWDDETLLFVRRSGTPAAWIAAHEYRRLIPTVPGMMQSPDYWRLHFRDLVLEAKHAAAEAPAALLPRVLLGLTFEYNGRDGDAARAFREALDLKPDHGPALLGLQRIRERHPEGLPDPTPRDAFEKEFGITP